MGEEASSLLVGEVDRDGNDLGAVDHVSLVLADNSKGLKDELESVLSLGMFLENDCHSQAVCASWAMRKSDCRRILPARLDMTSPVLSPPVLVRV